MKKLASVLVLGLAVSGIGGCGDDAPVPRPEAGVGDGGTKVGDGGGGATADGGGGGAEGGSVGNLDAGTGNTLDVASAPDLAPDVGGGGAADTQVATDGTGLVDGPVVVGLADGGGLVDGRAVVDAVDAAAHGDGSAAVDVSEVEDGAGDGGEAG
jgi:hypothetical protein